MEFSSNRLKQVHSSCRMFFQRNVTIYTGSNAPVGWNDIQHCSHTTIANTALSGSLSLHWAEIINWTQFWVKWPKWLKWHKIYHSVLNGWSTRDLSTFGEPKSQKLSVDYMQASKMNKITVETLIHYPLMQWKPHSCILTCPEHKFKSWIQLLKFNIFAQSVFNRSWLFTITLLTEVLNHREQRGAIENQSETLPHLHINIPWDSWNQDLQKPVFRPKSERKCLVPMGK